MSLTFSDLSAAAGLKELNAFLLGRTFVFGGGPSTADSALIALVKTAPDASKYPAAARWFNYISEFKPNEVKQFSKTILKVGLVQAAAAEAPKADDDSDDLFG